MLIVGRRNYRRAAARGSRRPYQGDAIGRRSAGYFRHHADLEGEDSHPRRGVGEESDN
jgi:hypothetical protein